MYRIIFRGGPKNGRMMEMATLPMDISLPIPDDPTLANPRRADSIFCPAAKYSTIEDRDRYGRVIYQFLKMEGE